MMQLDERLRELRTSTARGADVLDIGAALTKTRLRHQRRRHRRTALTGALVFLFVVGAVAIVGIVADRGGGPYLEVEERPGRYAEVEWQTFPGAPIAGRTGASAVATNTEFVIWGGRSTSPTADGAAYSSDSRTWRKLAPSPLSPRAYAIAVWTGEEVIIWGGVDENGNPLYDGAAYEPATDSWQTLQTVGAGAVQGMTGAVWTGRELVLTHVFNAPNAFLASDTYAFEPATGTWRDLPPAPASEDVRERAAVWTGTDVLVVSITDGEPVTIDRLDLVEETWGEKIRTRAPGLDTGADGVIWARDRLIVVGHYRSGAIFDPATGAVGELPPSGSALRFPAVWAGGVVFVGDRWLDVDSLRWHDTAPVPGPVREFPVAVGLQEQVYVWGGDACGPGASCVGLVDPEVGLAWEPTEARTSASLSHTSAPQACSATYRLTGGALTVTVVNLQGAGSVTVTAELPDGTSAVAIADLAQGTDHVTVDVLVPVTPSAVRVSASNQSCTATQID